MQNARGCVIAWAEAIWSRCHYLRSRFRLPTEERLVTSLTRLRDRRMEISDKSGKRGRRKREHSLRVSFFSNVRLRTVNTPRASTNRR